jgi:hypothetical protein
MHASDLSFQKKCAEILLVIVSDQRKRGNLLFPTTFYEIASVVLLPRNDSMSQLPEVRGLYPSRSRIASSSFLPRAKSSL